MYKEKCFSSHSQVERWDSYTKGSLTFNKLGGWGCISYAVETTEKEKYIFGVNNPIPLYSAGIILKHSSINQKLDCINRQMGSWSFRKAVGQSSSMSPIWQPEGEQSTALGVRQHVRGGGWPPNVTEWTTPHTTSHVCNLRSDLQAVIAMPLAIQAILALLNVTITLNLQVYEPTTAYLQEQEAAVIWKNLSSNLIKYSGGHFVQNIGLLWLLLAKLLLFKLSTLELDPRSLYRLWLWSDPFHRIGMSYLPFMPGKLIIEDVGHSPCLIDSQTSSVASAEACCKIRCTYLIWTV